MTYSLVSEDIRWVNAHYEELQEKYPGKYIVVKNQKVIVVAETHEKADNRVKELLGEWVEYTIEPIEFGDLFAYHTNI